MKNNTISLLNNEGDNLRLRRLDSDSFEILDQNQEVISKFNLVELQSWIDGDTIIHVPAIGNPSEEETWHYPSASGDKPSMRALYSFIKKGSSEVD
jgi:hypothetical protein